MRSVFEHMEFNIALHEHALPQPAAFGVAALSGPSCRVRQNLPSSVRIAGSVCSAPGCAGMSGFLPVIVSPGRPKVPGLFSFTCGRGRDSTRMVKFNYS